MSNKKVGLFSTFLFVGLAALFFPATALENSNAMAQEYHPDSDEYANGQEEY